MPATQPPPTIDQIRAQVSQMLDAYPSGNPISAIVLLEVNPAKEPPFQQLADALTVATRRLPGCNVFSFQRAAKAADPGQAIEYLIYEDWETCAFFRTQWGSDHLKQFQYSVGDLVLAAPDLRFYSGWREYRTFPSAVPAEQAQSLLERGSSLFTLPLTVSLMGMEQMARLFDSSAPGGSQPSGGSPFFNPLRMARQMSDAMQKAAAGATQGIFGSRQADSGTDSPWAQDASWMEDTSWMNSSPWSNGAPSSTPASPGPPASASPGWGPMPSPPPTQADPPTPHAPAVSSGPIGEPDISPDYPYAAHFVRVLGSRMHYIERGSGRPILLLHGNPSWSYIWRNIIPQLSSLGRCIAPDLIGFGRSDKPEIEYLWSDHARYLEAFIEAMNLHDIALVLHDQGSSLGFHYAMQHPHRIRSIAFFEAIVRPYPWDHFSTPEFQEIFRRFRTGGVDGEGWQLIVDQNIFIEQLLPQAAGRPLSEEEMDYYREPFIDKRSRVPIWRFPRQTPIGGEPKDVWNAVSEYSRQLCRSKLPKLMLYATPGALLTQEHVQWCQQNMERLESVFIGPGIHFLQESSPHRIGQEIAAWYRRLEEAGS